MSCMEPSENYGQKHGFKLLKQIRNQRVVSKALLLSDGRCLHMSCFFNKVISKSLGAENGEGQ
jgi:hypothetical protein